MAGSVHKVYYCQTQIYHSNAMAEHCRCREGFDLAVAAGIMLIKSLYDELSNTRFTHNTHI